MADVWDWPQTAAQATSSAYCLHGEGYHSRGAYLEMSGVTRICETRTEDGDVLEWLDPDTVRRRR